MALDKQIVKMVFKYCASHTGPTEAVLSLFQQFSDFYFYPYSGGILDFGGLKYMCLYLPAPLNQDPWGRRLGHLSSKLVLLDHFHLSCCLRLLALRGWPVRIMISELVCDLPPIIEGSMDIPASRL